MTFNQFEASLTGGAGAEPPAELSPYLVALWHDARGDWTTAHEIVQDLHTQTAARVHAYIHRKEGDESNARYWYGTAGTTFPGRQSLEEEWRGLVEEFL
ncbi:MAG: hypothetical protein ACREEM_38920 [Blastocatellia bacterium]